MSTGGEVANALVCKTSIRGFDPRPVLQNFKAKGATEHRRAFFVTDVHNTHRNPIFDVELSGVFELRAATR